MSPTLIHVTVPRRIASRDGIRVHSVSELAKESVTIWKGLRVTTPARTAIDLAGEPITDYQFGRSVHEAQVQRILRIPQLEAELQRMPARFKGRKRLTAEIDLGPTRTRSGFEEWGGALLRRRQLSAVRDQRAPAEHAGVGRGRRLLPPAAARDRARRRPSTTGRAWRRPQDAKKRKLVRDGGTEVLVLTDEDGRPDREEQTVAKIWAALEDAAT